jgi:hypothetical protein
MTGDTADPDAWSKASPKEGGKGFHDDATCWHKPLYGMA